jgi:amidase
VPGDPYPLPLPARPFSESVRKRPRKLRLAALSESTLAEVEEDTLKAFESACREFRSMGHRVERIKLDLARLREPVQTVVVAGISSNRVADPELIEPVTRAIWQSGREISAADYLGAVVQMHNIAREIVQSLMPYDALLTPTLTRPAVRLGTLPNKQNPYVHDRLGRPVAEVYTWLAFTFPFNATGQPAISVPNGFSRSGLPIGLQIVGRPTDEAGILSLAAAFEQARPWHDQHPPVD